MKHYEEAPLLIEERGRILVLTLNRPQSKNAMSLQLAQELAHAFEEFDGNDGLSVCVITGSGGTFCAGMDLKGFARGEIPVVPSRGFAGMVGRPPLKPIIAAVEGYALGGGFEIALACDLIVAANNAAFGLPEVKRGLTANGGGLLRIQHRLPYHFAMELVLTGRMLPAAEAAGLHLVNRVAEPGGALVAALDLAEEIAKNAPLALTASKQVMVHSGDWAVGEKFSRQQEYVGSIGKSNDAVEGARAFIEKRVPMWSGS
ncbi:enoyl-CoA hydratase [Arthrobacter sp. ERGS1:01]|uniref:crotonase/enoyl-CoA hydratase family protein n=1 Tax=Arthrobacter sp. ERGS1:01 TaxID=1704044 RepID=UPI0006B66ADE|nr:crotonase/enoyl-CoA hydratase family protein [Arthrobacter sp. ERGS1:01]ALE05690.1 enoyl-CoA hydratase [Arthrobacter sp. ERGS1:01]